MYGLVTIQFCQFWTKLSYSYNTFIYLQSNIRTSRERNPPHFERGTSYGSVLAHLRSKNARA